MYTYIFFVLIHSIDENPTNQPFLLFRKLGETNCPNLLPKDVGFVEISWTLSLDLLKVMFVSGDSWMYPYQRTPIGNPNISPIACGYLWVLVFYPQESLENTIDTMGTLLGVHPIVPCLLLSIVANLKDCLLMKVIGEDVLPFLSKHFKQNNL